MKEREINMTILFFILITILLSIFYYELRIATSNLSRDFFREYYFLKRKFMGKDVFILSKIQNNNTSKKYKQNKVILYLHGGSYVGKIEKYHWNFLKDIIEDTNATIIIPDYPLTPEKTYIDVFKMMEPLYKEIIENIKDKEFILMGDSAGAGMALALYQRNGKLNRRLPDKTILISPWLDVRMNNSEIDKINDPVLKRSLLKLSGKKYAGKNGLKSYLVNPVLGPTDKLKNIYILSGTKDILNPDAKKFAILNKEKVIFLEYEEAIHNFILMKNRRDTLYAKEGYNKIIEIISKKE